jgi:hypothetical protein
MKHWQAPVPTTPKNKDRKRCYTLWTHMFGDSYAGGKVVWLTDAELTLAYIKYPKKRFKLILEKDKLEEYKKYIHQTID